MSIAILKELLLRAGVTDRPFQLFDLISGTSAGGIISVLFGNCLDFNELVSEILTC
jgi:patatin-like phospholipase/acyl hydrolase